MLKKNQVDQRETELLNTFFSELNFNKEIKLYVIKRKEFNAISLPDGTIFVFDEVFNNLKTYSELSALLAHEYSHIKNRHGIKGLARALSWQFIGGIITGEDHSSNFIKNANMILDLNNSRKFETEADLDGLQLLRDHNIDERGMVNLFKIMDTLEAKDDKIFFDYLRTHPPTRDRLNTIERNINETNNDYMPNEKLENLFNEIIK